MTFIRTRYSDGFSNSDLQLALILCHSFRHVQLVAAVAQLVEALRYKPEGHVFDS